MDSLTAEVKALEADESDRAEMLAVAALMEGLRAEVRKLFPIFSPKDPSLDGNR